MPLSHEAASSHRRHQIANDLRSTRCRAVAVCVSNCATTTPYQVEQPRTPWEHFGWSATVTPQVEQLS